MFLLTQAHSAPSVLAAAIEAQLSRVCAELAAAKRKPRQRSVHELRVAVRRLTAALELARALGRRVRPRSHRLLRKLLNALSPLRDAQVQARAVAGAPVSSATQAIAKLLRQRERALRRHTKRHLRSLELAKLGKDVGSLIHALLHDVQSAELVEHALLGELARRHLEVERRRGQSEHDQARGLHRARLALKDYRYELEVLASLLPARSEALRVTATELQAQLGQAHDQHVLSRRVRRLARTAPAKLGPPLKSLAEALDQQSAAAQLSGASALRAANLQFPS